MKVLIATADTALRFHLRNLLKNEDYTPEEAADGREAWAFFTKENDPPRIALLDISLPEIGPVEICRGLAARESETPIYKILMLPEEQKTELPDAMAGGFDDYITLPILPEKIRRRLLVGRRYIDMCEETQQLATIDSLTGVYNRHAFLSIAKREFERARRYNRPFSLLLMDIDHFRRINEIFGHVVGDETLKHLTDESLRILRNSDILGRVGGDEFGVLLCETGRKAAMEAGGRLRENLADIRIHADRNIVTFSVCIGITVLDSNVGGIDDMMNRAERALQQAKAAGPNRLTIDGDEISPSTDSG